MIWSVPIFGSQNRLKIWVVEVAIFALLLLLSIAIQQLKKKCLYVPSQTTVLKVKGNTTMAIVEMWLTLSSCLFSNIAESLLQVQLISDLFFWKRISSKNRQATVCVWACDNILISCFLYSDSQMSTYLVGLYGKVISWYVCIFQILSHTSM